MNSIPDEKIQEVRDHVDIVDLVGRYVELRRAGRNFKGLCPFHGERTPSFNVNPERKGYKCFGCGAGGDAIRFVMEIEGKSFPEALRKLGELYGVQLPQMSSTPASAARAHEKDEAYALLSTAAQRYSEILFDDPMGEAGRRYLRTRDLTPEIARTFGLGYAPAPAEGGWDTLVKTFRARGLSLEAALRLGLTGRSERTGNDYDKFRGRLMFPVIAPGGEVIAFSGRIVPPHEEGDADRPPPKYVNSAESVLYTKGKSLFGLATARAAIRTSRRAILVEGNIDVVKLHQWGHGETIAPLGTALTSEQATLVARFAEQVVMCFDGDRAGKKAAWAALPLLLESDLDVRMVLLPEGQDPDSLGAERFGALLARAKPALEEMMVRIAARAGDAAHARARGLDRLVPLIATVRRDSARELYVQRTAELFRLSPSRVESAVRAAASARSSPRERRSADAPRQQFPSISHGPVPVSAAVRASLPLPAGQAQLTMLLVDVPHLAAVAERSGASACITDSRLAPIANAVLQGAREGRNPSMDELLGRVEPDHQADVYRAVFGGRYRPDADGGDGVDPRVILDSLVLRCREEALTEQIRELDARIASAQDEGFPDKALELGNARLELRRRQAALRQQPMGASDAPSRHEI